jgi:hypothetical protein
VAKDTLSRRVISPATPPCVVVLSVLLALAVGLRAQGPAAAAREPVRRSPHANGALFAHSDDCVACHNNLVTAGGEDVSIGTAWRATIMANASRDPYFHASARRETIDHPSKSADVEDECAACHLPIAHKSAHAAGRQARILGADGSVPHDRLERDGVSCTVCHQVSSEGLGSRESFNGNFRLRAARPDGVREIFGPFAVDQGRHTIMRSVTGFEQVEAAHIRQSELCATCHTLITEALDSDGRVVGSLPEQMNFQEWRHSAYYGEGRSCQSCHMPRVEGPVRVSSVLGDLRDGLSRHAFVGGNAFMLRMMNRFRGALGIEAAASEMEATARLTERQLQQDTVTLSVSAPVVSDRSLGFDVDVRNLTGHKFPTGYPARRAWLHVTVRDGRERVLFESGAIDTRGAIAGNENDADPAAFEVHHDIIDRSDQVQIYESVLGDSHGRVTTGLLSAVGYLKDNRLLPRGFDKATADPEISVYGAANEDATFAGGGDRTHYQIPASPATGYVIEVEMRYQPIGYRWAHNLEGYKALEPERFLEYYEATSPQASTSIAHVSTTVRPQAGTLNP